MANRDDRLRSFLCPELWQWSQSDSEDENEDANLLLQARNEFYHTAAACTCSTTSHASAALLLTPRIFQIADSDSDSYTKSGRFMNDRVTVRV